MTALLGLLWLGSLLALARVGLRLQGQWEPFAVAALSIILWTSFAGSLLSDLGRPELADLTFLIPAAFGSASLAVGATWPIGLRRVLGRILGLGDAGPVVRLCLIGAGLALFAPSVRAWRQVEAARSQCELWYSTALTGRDSLVVDGRAPDPDLGAGRTKDGRYYGPTPCKALVLVKR